MDTYDRLLEILHSQKEKIYDTGVELYEVNETMNLLLPLFEANHITPKDQYSFARELFSLVGIVLPAA